MVLPEIPKTMTIAQLYDLCNNNDQNLKTMLRNVVFSISGFGERLTLYWINFRTRNKFIIKAWDLNWADSDGDKTLTRFIIDRDYIITKNTDQMLDVRDYYLGSSRDIMSDSDDSDSDSDDEAEDDDETETETEPLIYITRPIIIIRHSMIGSNIESDDDSDSDDSKSDSDIDDDNDNDDDETETETETEPLIYITRPLIIRHSMIGSNIESDDDSDSDDSKSDSDSDDDNDNDDWDKYYMEKWNLLP